MEWVLEFQLTSPETKAESSMVPEGLMTNLRFSSGFLVSLVIATMVAFLLYWQQQPSRAVRGICEVDLAAVAIFFRPRADPP